MKPLREHYNHGLVSLVIVSRYADSENQRSTISMQQWLSKYLPISVAIILAAFWYALLMVLILIFINTGNDAGARYWGL